MKTKKRKGRVKGESEGEMREEITNKDKQRLSPIVTDAEGKDTIVIYAHNTPCKNRYFKQHPELRGIVPVCTGKDDQNTIQKALNEITVKV